MDTTASGFTLRKNAKRAAEAMIRKGIAPAVDYGIKLSDDGRFEIVWKIATSAPTTDEVETEIAEAPVDQPAAALPTEANNPHQRPPSPRRLTLRRSPRPGDTDPAVSLSKPAPNEWPYGTHVMVRERKSWREATIISHLDPDHWRAEYPGGGAGMVREADIRAYDPKRDAVPAKQPRRAKPTTPQKSSRARTTLQPPRRSRGATPAS